MSGEIILSPLNCFFNALNKQFKKSYIYLHHVQRQIEIEKHKLYADKNFVEILKNKNFEGYDLTYRELDPIRIKSGQVSFFDAYSKADVKPFMQKFEYAQATPFAFSIAGAEGSSRIAFAGLRFSKDEPLYFKLALHEEKDVVKLMGDTQNPVSTPIHSGFLGMSDHLAQYDFARFVASRPTDDHPLEDVVRFDGDTAVVYKFKTTQRICVFSSGFGDGEYPAYIGYAANNKAVIIICDFQVVASSQRTRIEGTETFTFDLSIEQLYQNNPNLTDDENTVAKWSFVIQNKDELDAFSFYRAHAKRAYAYHSLQQYEKALKDYYVAIALSERLPQGEAQKIRAWTLYDNAGLINRQDGNLDEAIRLFEKGKAVGDHFYTGAHVNLIEIHMIQENFEQALLEADEMVALRPQDQLGYIKRAEIQTALGDYEKAIENYDVLIVRFSWSEALLDKVSALSSLERHDEALQILQIYINQYDPNDTYYYHLGFLQLKKDRYSEAYESLLSAYEYNPDSIYTLQLLIEIEQLLFDHPRIVKWATKYIDLRPNDEYGYAVRAEAYRILGKYSLALADFEYIIDRLSRDPRYLKNLVVTAISAKSLKKAERVLKQLKGERGGWYAISFALVLEKRGKFQKAIRTYGVAALDSQNDHILSLATDFYIRIKNAVKAAETLNRLREYSTAGVYLIREYNFYRAFAGTEPAERVLDEYLEAVLSQSGARFNRNEIKKRIRITAKRHV